MLGSVCAPGIMDIVVFEIKKDCGARVCDTLVT